VTLKSGLEATEGHWNWCHSKAWVRFPEIFSVKEWCDLENKTRVRSRSLEMAPLDRSHTSSYSPSIVTMVLSCIVGEI